MHNNNNGIVLGCENDQCQSKTFTECNKQFKFLTIFLARHQNFDKSFLDRIWIKNIYNQS